MAKTTAMIETCTTVIRVIEITDKMEDSDVSKFIYKVLKLSERYNYSLEVNKAGERDRSILLNEEPDATVPIKA